MAMTRWLIDTRSLWKTEDEVLSPAERGLIEAPLFGIFLSQGGATANTRETVVR